MADPIVIYGATGYTGKLIARRAAEVGLEPTLAGRDAGRTAAVAEPLGFAHRAVSLDDAAGLDALLDGAAVALHVAGPFSATSKPMADACLRTDTHYLDVTGEIDVFEALAARDEEAEARGVMLMPGVGFDVVPSDCLAAHVARRLPTATSLRLFIAGLGGASRGTAKTAVEGLGTGTRVRRDGEIVSLKRAPRDRVDFGRGERPVLAVGWGDVATAYHTTGIPNVEVYFKANRQLELFDTLGRHFGWLMGSKPMEHLLKGVIDRQPPGPSDEERERGGAILVAEARDDAGDVVRSRLTTPEGYTLTARTAVAIAQRVASNDAARPGFHTPGGLFGPDFILEFEGCEREDLSS